MLFHPFWLHFCLTGTVVQDSRGLAVAAAGDGAEGSGGSVLFDPPMRNNSKLVRSFGMVASEPKQGSAARPVEYTPFPVVPFEYGVSSDASFRALQRVTNGLCSLYTNWAGEWCNGAGLWVLLFHSLADSD